MGEAQNAVQKSGPAQLSHMAGEGEISKGPEAVSTVLDADPQIFEHSLKDLVGIKDAQTGRLGMGTVPSGGSLSLSQAVPKSDLQGACLPLGGIESFSLLCPPGSHPVPERFDSSGEHQSHWPPDPGSS